MATGTQADFKVYDDLFQTGAQEMLTKNINVFNAASGGTMLLGSSNIRGDYAKEAFYNRVAGLVSRRDITSVADATVLKMTEGEEVSVKLSRKIGPVEQTLEAFRRIARDPEEMSYILGQQWAEEMMVDAVQTMTASLVAAIGNNSDAFTDANKATAMDFKAINEGKRIFGDQHSRIRALLMNSNSYFNLLDQGLDDKVDSVAGAIVRQGTAATQGLITIVVDDDSLTFDDAGTQRDRILFLTEGAVQFNEQGDRTIISELVTGKENLIGRFQGEYNSELAMKGVAWDTTNGGVNPNAAALALGTNWDYVQDYKNGPGSMIVRLA